MRRIGWVTALLVLLAATAAAQGDISAQVLRLLGRANYWTNLNTFAQTMGLKLERGVLAPTVTVDRLYNLSGSLYWNGSPVGGGSSGVTSITAGTGIVVTGTASVPIVGLSNQISSGSCTDCNITYNAQGQITIAANGAGGGGVPSSRTLTAGTGLSGGGDLSANRSFAIANTGVVAGSYGDGTNVPVPVINAQGQITSISTVAISPTTATHNFLSATHPDTVASAPVRGGVVVANSTPKWAQLALCTAQYFLGSNGTDTVCSNNGSQLINLNGSNVSTGTVQDARLTANVALLGRDPQVFAGENTFEVTLAGEHTVSIQNDSASALAYSTLRLIRNGAITAAELNAYSAAFTSVWPRPCPNPAVCTDPDQPDSTLLVASGSRGLGIMTNGNASLMRFYTHGTSAALKQQLTIGDFGGAFVGTSTATANGEYGPINGPVHGSLYVAGRLGVGCGFNDPAGFNQALPNGWTFCIEAPSDSLDNGAAQIWTYSGATAATEIIGVQSRADDTVSSGSRVVTFDAVAQNGGAALDIAYRAQMNATTDYAFAVIRGGTYQTLLYGNGDFSTAGAMTASGLPTGAGGGGLYVCVDNVGVFYKKSACP